jgi:ArsR family transcriptional regulator, arsenate/arsenite/antimonite-responsive transcriptional repressor
MKLKTKHQYDVRARVAKALAHPSRLLILDALGEGEICVCKLTPLIGADQSTVSKHLAILKSAGLIEDRKQGVMTYYRLKCCCLEGFWKCIESVLKQNLKEQEAALQT